MIANRIGGIICPAKWIHAVSERNQTISDHVGSLNIYFLMEDNIDVFETTFCVHKLQRESQWKTFIVRVYV